MHTSFLLSWLNKYSGFCLSEDVDTKCHSQLAFLDLKCEGSSCWSSLDAQQGSKAHHSQSINPYSLLLEMVPLSVVTHIFSVVFLW